MFLKQFKTVLSSQIFKTIFIQLSKHSYSTILTQQTLHLNTPFKKDQQIQQIDKLNQLFDTFAQIQDIRHSPTLINQIRNIKNKQFMDFSLNTAQRRILQSSLHTFLQHCDTNQYNISDLAQLLLFIEDLKELKFITNNQNQFEQVFIKQLNKLGKLSEQEQINMIDILEILNSVNKDRTGSSLLQEFYRVFVRKVQEQEIQGSVIARVLFVYKLEQDEQKYQLKELESELLMKVDELRAQNFQHFIKLYYLIQAVGYQNLQLFNLIEQELIEIMDRFNIDGFKNLMNWMKYSRNLSTQFCMKFEKVILSRLYRFKTLEQLNEILNFIQLGCFDYNSDGIYKITQIIIENNIHNLQDMSNPGYNLDYKLSQNEENKKIFMNLNRAKYLEIQNLNIKSKGRIPTNKQIILDSSIYSEHRIQFKDTFEYLVHEINNAKRLEQINKYLQLLLQFGMNNNQTKQVLYNLHKMFMILISNQTSKYDFKVLINVIHNLIKLRFFFNLDELLVFNTKIAENIDHQIQMIHFRQLFLKIYEFGMIQQIQGMQHDNLQITMQTVRNYLTNLKKKLSIVQAVKLLHIVTLSPLWFDKELFEKVNTMLQVDKKVLTTFENQQQLKKEYFQAVEKYKLMVGHQELDLQKLQNKLYNEGKLSFEESSSRFNNRIFSSQSILIKFIQEYLDIKGLADQFMIQSNQVIQVFHIDIILTELQTDRKILIKIQKSQDSYVNIKQDSQNIPDHHFIACLQWIEQLGFQYLNIDKLSQSLLWNIHQKQVADHFTEQLDMII